MVLEEIGHRLNHTKHSPKQTKCLQNDRINRVVWYKWKRYHKGVYEVEVLDIDEDPCEKYYHGYILEKITPENLAEYRDMAFTGVAPDELFDVYSDLFKIFEKFEYGEITEEEILSQLKEIGYT